MERNIANFKYLKYLRAGRKTFTIKSDRHRDYWQQQQYTVTLVIRTSDGTIRWMDISAYLKATDCDRDYDPRHPNRITFTGEDFTAANLRRMRDRFIPLQD